MVELRIEDPASFQNFVRFEPDMFQELVDRVSPIIAKQDTNFRKALDPGLKIAVTLRYLATGETSKSLGYGFRVAYNSICIFLPEVCRAIVQALGDEVMKTPTTPDEWRAVSEYNRRRWQMAHCLGAFDGKHIRIRKPYNSGSTYFNYKKFFSLVLMALVDGNYKFLWVDVGAQGSCCDGQVFNECQIKQRLDNDQMGFPPAEPLANDDQDMEYFFIGDDAFSLRTYMMKPYSRSARLPVPERVFNYRLSRVRRVVENAFGILANRFGFLLTSLYFQPDKVCDFVVAAVCCHNLMRMRYPGLHNAIMDREDVDHTVLPGDWRIGNTWEAGLETLVGNQATKAAKKQREYLKEYYNSPAGSIPWQMRMI